MASSIYLSIYTHVYIYMSVCVRAGAHGLDHRKSEGETSCIVNLKEQGLESE